MSELIPLAHPGISSLARRPFKPSFSLWPMEVAKSLIGSFLKSFRAVIPAAADKGFALNVPLWAMRLVLSHSGSPEGSIMLIISAFPATAPPGNPPPRILAKVVRSGVIP